MRIINSNGDRKHFECFSPEIDGPTKIIFTPSIEDIMISSPDGDVLFGFDYSDEANFTKDNAMLLKPHDNLKEFGKERCSNLYIMPKEDGVKLRIYVAIER